MSHCRYKGERRGILAGGGAVWDRGEVSRAGQGVQDGATDSGAQKHDTAIYNVQKSSRCFSTISSEILGVVIIPVLKPRSADINLCRRIHHAGRMRSSRKSTCFQKQISESCLLISRAPEITRMLPRLNLLGSLRVRTCSKTFGRGLQT
jgi:hypothetical protein